MDNPPKSGTTTTFNPVAWENHLQQMRNFFANTKYINELAEKIRQRDKGENDELKKSN